MSLVLIELSVMLFAMAMASALCLKVFLWADASSKENATRDMALVQMQSAAEVLKNQKDYARAADLLEGTWDGSHLRILQADYEICIVPRSSEQPGLQCAHMEAICREQVLVSFDICWQEAGE